MLKLQVIKGCLILSVQIRLQLPADVAGPCQSHQSQGRRVHSNVRPKCMSTLFQNSHITFFKDSILYSIVKFYTKHKFYAQVKKGLGQPISLSCVETQFKINSLPKKLVSMVSNVVFYCLLKICPKQRGLKEV